MRTILCTVGTSIAQGCPSLPNYFKEHHPWEADASGLVAEIQLRMEQPQYDLATADGRIAASAELNSLQRLACSPEDQVILLATDTAEGRASAEALRGYISTAFDLPENSCRIEHITGLQVRDAIRLRGEGLPSLCRIALGYLRSPQRKYGGGVIINPTGGFKGVVPFMAILAALYGARAVYIFENSQALGDQPPRPICLDHDLFEQVAEALLWGREKCVFRPEEFYARIPGFEETQRDRVNGFLEFDPEGNSTLSPLAAVLLEDEENFSGDVLLAPEAAKKLASYRGDVREHVVNLLRRAGSPAWRFANGHSFKGTDLRVFGNSRFNFRVAGFLADNAFHVCEFYYDQHDFYEKDLPGKLRAQYPATGDFSALPDPEPKTDDAPLSTYADLRDRIETLDRELTKERRSHTETRRSAQDKIWMFESRIQRLERQLTKRDKPRKSPQKSTAAPLAIPTGTRLVASLVKIRNNRFIYKATYNESEVLLSVPLTSHQPEKSPSLSIEGPGTDGEFLAVFAETEPSR